jgi:hypothetical protein
MLQKDGLDGGMAAENSHQLGTAVASKSGYAHGRL